MQINKQQRLNLGVLLQMFPLLGRIIAPKHAAASKNYGNSLGRFLRSRERVLHIARQGTYCRAKHGPLRGVR